MWFGVEGGRQDGHTFRAVTPRERGHGISAPRRYQLMAAAKHVSFLRVLLTELPLEVLRGTARTTGPPLKDGERSAIMSRMDTPPPPRADSPLERKEVLAILMKSYELSAAEIQNTVSANDRLVAMGITAIGAGVSYGLISGKSEVFLALPVLLVSVYVYAVLNHHNISYLGGYKRFLEGRINALAGENLLVWEHVVAERSRWHIVNVPLISAYVTLLLGVIYLSLHTVFAQFSPGVAYGVSAFVALLCACLIPSLAYWFTAPSRAFALAVAVSKRSPEVLVPSGAGPGADTGSGCGRASAPETAPDTKD